MNDILKSALFKMNFKFQFGERERAKILHAYDITWSMSMPERPGAHKLSPG